MILALFGVVLLLGVWPLCGVVYQWLRYDQRGLRRGTPIYERKIQRDWLLPVFYAPYLGLAELVHRIARKQRR